MNPERNAEGGNILVVDDDAGVRDVIADSLRQAGYSVTEVASGVEALEAFDERTHDLIVLDVLMPDADGYETCVRLRRDETRSPVPILFVTGLDDPQSIDRAFDAGGNDFITKPFHPMILRQRVRQLLRTGRITRALSESERRLSAAQLIANVGHWEIDLETQEEFWSEAALTLFDAADEQQISFRDTIVASLHPDDRDEATRLYDAARTQGQPLDTDLRIVDSGGQLRFLHVTGKAVSTYGRSSNCLTFTVQDVTERKSNEERIRILAYYDGLTRLANRQHFVECVTRDVFFARRGNTPLAVLFIDLDRFHRVNDSLGHRVGDMILVQVSERIQSIVRESDEVARVSSESDDTDLVARAGGDVFAISLRSLAHREHAAIVARRMLEAIKQPFEIEGHQLAISASIGVSIFPTDGDDVDSLLKCADVAMQRSKARGLGGFCFYDPGMNANAFRRLTMEQALRQSLANGEFEIYYQPQVRASDEKLAGLEALLRWHHDGLGIVPPNEFIPLAEECGMLEAIGEWVIYRVCETAARWRRDGLLSIPIAVNISSRHVQSGLLVGQIDSALEATGLASDALEIEITERVFMDSPDVASAVLAPLRERGVSIALDDFGTGFSSLSYLRRLPVDRLKIDKSFVRNVYCDEPEAAIVSAIVTMARGLNLGVVAEGVELEKQQIALRALGCTVLQGYLFGRPMPLVEAEEYLRAVAVEDPATV